MKQMNREGILYQLKQKRMSRAELAAETKLSRPCISSLVDEMIGEGLIREIGTGQSRGGRKPVLLEYNSQAFAVVGAVYEGNCIHMAIADLHGHILSRYQARLKPPADGEKALAALEAGLTKLLGQCSFERSQLHGIGIGLPGITERNKGTISFAPSTGWMGQPVRQALEERLGLPVFIDNDVNMMTIGEFYQGAGRGAKNLIQIYVGSGIGAGIVINGQLYRGSKEAAGEIGYMMIGPFRNRSQREYGVFESNFGVPGILSKAQPLLPSWEEGAPILPQLQAAAAEGHPEARALLQDTYRHWAFGMANVASIMDPELLVLGGEMIHLDEQGLQTIQELLSRLIPVVPVIKTASLGDQAGIIGAVHCVLESFPNHRSWSE